MPLLLTEAHRLFFVHVPKTGGTTIEDYLSRRFGPLCLSDKNKRLNVRGTGLINSITHLAAVDLEEMIPANCDLCFTVVRDPLKRAQSEFRWQQGASSMSRMSFSTWLRVVIRAARLEPRIYDNHIRPQSDLVPENTEVFRLEDGFERMIARIDAVTNTAAPDIKPGHFKKTSQSSEKQSADPSRQDIELIAEYYAADYDRFGYSRPDPSAFPSDPWASVRNAQAMPIAAALTWKQHRDWLR